MAATVSVKFEPGSTWGNGTGTLYASDGSGSYNRQTFNPAYDKNKTLTIEVMDNDLLILAAPSNTYPHRLSGGSGMYKVMEQGTGVGNAKYVVVYKVTQSTSCTLS